MEFVFCIKQQIIEGEIHNSLKFLVYIDTKMINKMGKIVDEYAIA